MIRWKQRKHRVRAVACSPPRITRSPSRWVTGGAILVQSDEKGEDRDADFSPRSEMGRDMRSWFVRTSVGLLLFTSVSACRPDSFIASAMDSRSPAVHFELKTEPVWQVPEPGRETEVLLALELSNLGTEPIRFPLMDRLRISIESPDGVVRVMEGGMDGLRPGKPISDPVAPGETFALTLTAQISRGADNRPRVRIADAFGSVWWIGPLDTGTNLVHATYESRSVDEVKNQEIWAGQAVIAPVSVEIRTHRP